MPAVALTDPKPVELKHAAVLLNGLSEARAGFSPLRHVQEELEDIRKITGGRILLDGEYTIANLSDELKKHEYSVIHMATHARFGAGSGDTYLLAYDGRLTMEHLSQLISIGRFRENPVELLTLSACQTAVGDERAALGLAGVALKADARSAVATLWFVSDKAASLAVREFYRNLKMSGMSKAKALQEAQKKLIAHPDYSHPVYWAPFLLIGNWL